MAEDQAYEAPGLRRMPRHNGRIDNYWVCSKGAAKRGYSPRTVRLPSEWTMAQLSARCLILQAEMLKWMGGAEATRAVAEKGTIRWFCDAYETNAESPFHERRKDTQIFYRRYMKMLCSKAGDHRVARIRGDEVRKWHRELQAAHGQRSAYATVQTLRRIISYGCELRDTDCYDVAKMLERMEFKVPRARKARPTYPQIVDLRAAAIKAGRPSIALAVSLQFELSLRQKDVIGEWTRPAPADRENHEGAITDGLWIWGWGLTWNHIDSNHVLSKPTSKSNGNELAEHDLSLHPEILAMLLPRGVGPIILEEKSRLPWKKEHFSRTFRKIATAAKWPEGLWNMDSKAGGVTEAFDAGAAPSDVMRAATHTQMSTTMLYSRGGVAQTSRVTELRAAKRRKPDGA